MDMRNIREAREEDFVQIEEMLLEHKMLVPAIDGREAMKRIQQNMGRYFLVAKENNTVVGFIRAVYDGSRALIHQMAVRKSYQRKGIGRELLFEVCKRLNDDGAPTVSVTATEQSQPYYEKFSFRRLPITLMLGEDIHQVIDTARVKSEKKG